MLAEEATVVLPVVMPVLDLGGGEAKQAGGGGEDAHHLGPAVDRGVQALDGVGAGDGASVICGEGHVGEHVSLGPLEQRSGLGEARLEQLEGVAHRLVGGLRGGLAGRGAGPSPATGASMQTTSRPRHGRAAE